MKRTKVLITGSGGFIGSFLSNSLSTDFDVVTWDRNSNFDSCENMTPETNFGDRLKTIDVIVHCAALCHRAPSQHASILHDSVNYQSTINFARQAKESGVRKFIFLSSVNAARFDNSDLDSFSVNDNSETYAFFKKKAEISLQQVNMDTVILRLPTVYGPYVKANFRSLISLIDKGCPLPFGNLERPKKSYLSLYNLSELVSKVILCNKESRAIFNVTDNCDISTKMLVNTLSKHLNKGGGNFNAPYRLLVFLSYIPILGIKLKYFLNSSVVDCTETMEFFNWVPDTTFDRAVEMTVKAYRDENK